MTIRFDKFVHNLPRFYKLKVTLINKSKHFLNKHFLCRLLGIKKHQDAIEELHIIKREKAFQRFFTGKMILDIGCGRGDFMSYFQKRYSCDCIGLDISKNMIFYAKENNPDHEYIIGSSDFLPFANNSVNVVHFHHVFHHLPTNLQKKILEESKRVAKEVVMINDNVNWENRFKRFLANIFWKITDGGYIYIGQKLNGGSF